MTAFFFRLLLVCAVKVSRSSQLDCLIVIIDIPMLGERFLFRVGRNTTNRWYDL